MNRVHVVLHDLEKRTIHTHGIVVAPQGMNTQKAGDAVSKAYQQAVAANPETWTYGDMIDRLKRQGFDEIHNEIVVAWKE